MSDEILKSNVGKIEPWPDLLDVTSFNDDTYQLVADPDSAFFTHDFKLSSVGYASIYVSLEYRCLSGHFIDDIFYNCGAKFRKLPFMVFTISIDNFPDDTTHNVNGISVLTLNDDEVIIEMTNGSTIPVVSCDIIHSRWHGIDLFKLMKDINIMRLKYK